MPVDLRPAVRPVPHLGRPAQRPAERHRGVCPPVGALVRFDGDRDAGSEPLVQSPFEEGPEQRCHPRAAAVGLADRLQPQPFPALDDLAGLGAHHDVVNVGVAVLLALHRRVPHLRPAVELAPGRVQPLDTGRQQRAVRYADLVSVHQRVAHARVAQ